MPVKFPSARAGSSRLALILIALACLVYSAAGTKPWHTRALEPFSEDSTVPLRDFTLAGLWIGLTLAGVLALVLLGLSRWWAGSEAVRTRKFSVGGGGSAPALVFRGGGGHRGFRGCAALASHEPVLLGG